MRLVYTPRHRRAGYVPAQRASRGVQHIQHTGRAKARNYVCTRTHAGRMSGRRGRGCRGACSAAGACARQRGEWRPWNGDEGLKNARRRPSWGFLAAVALGSGTQDPVPYRTKIGRVQKT